MVLHYAAKTIYYKIYHTNLILYANMESKLSKSYPVKLACM